MYQGYDGQWYDDNGQPTQEPGQFAPGQFTSGPSFTNTSSVSPSRPSGVPDPKNPGYDTAGFLLNSTYDPNAGPAGIVTPNPTTPTGGSGTGQPASPASAPGFFPGYSFTPYSGFTPFSYDSYTPLSADQAKNEPGYAFAAQQGRDAVQTAQASKGNILSGAALKDLFAWGDQFAGQNYQNAEARNENVYSMNRGNAFNNWAANETGKYQTWAGNNQPAQFAATLGTNQAGLTLADLFNRFSSTGNWLSNIATAGAK